MPCLWERGDLAGRHVTLGYTLLVWDIFFFFFKMAIIISSHCRFKMWSETWTKKTFYPVRAGGVNGSMKPHAVKYKTRSLQHHHPVEAGSARLTADNCCFQCETSSCILNNKTCPPRFIFSINLAHSPVMLPRIISNLKHLTSHQKQPEQTRNTKSKVWLVESTTPTSWCCGNMMFFSPRSMDWWFDRLKPDDLFEEDIQILKMNQLEHSYRWDLYGQADAGWPSEKPSMGPRLL